MVDCQALEGDGDKPVMDHSKSRKRKTSKTQKKAVIPEEGEDFISDLPDEIKHKILSYLSARAAAQTSALSSKWRNTWASGPEVSIGEADFVSPGASVQKTRNRFVKFVDVFLGLHKAPILKFKLESDLNNNYRDAFDLWILHLSRRNELRELSFKLCSTHLYILPSNLFSCHGLSFLRLHDCHIKLPRGFQGFKSMRVLELQGCRIHEDDLEKFVSSCPTLVELEMKTGMVGRSRFMIHYGWVYNSNASPNLKIHAPMLKKLIIHGRFASLLLKTPCLAKACFELSDFPASVNVRCNLLEALGSLSEIEALGFHYHSLVYLLAGFLPNHLPLPFNKLRMLALEVDLASTEEASLLRFLLESSLNLQELQLTNSIKDGPLNSVRSWQDGPHVFFMSLRIVVLDRFLISESEIAFLKFILASAPLLEQLTIISEEHARKKEVVSEILEGIPKFSRNLQITFE